MTKVITSPAVYLLGKQTVLDAELDRFLADHGVAWETDSEVAAEVLTETAGRVCYMSYAKPRPGGNAAYLRHIKAVGHGSVLEHAVWTFLVAGVSRTLTHELVRHRAGWAYCLAGDTEVYGGSQQHGRFDGVKKKWTIRKLYEWSQDPIRKGRLRLVTVRCFDGERFVPAKLKAVTASGEKDLFEVRLADGKVVRCSADHRFLTPGGWNAVRDLAAGEPLGTNGRVGYRHSAETKLKLAEQKRGDRNPQWRGDSASPQAGRLRAQRAYPDQPCEACGNPEGHRHHRDRNTLNNAPDNVEFLCASCHTLRHHEEDGHPGELRVKWVAIQSITPAGREMTYDLEVDHPAHNFVANGFVTHNSQLSQRYVDESVAEYVEPDIIAGDPELHALWLGAVEHAHAAYVTLAEKLNARLADPQAAAAAMLPPDADRTLRRKTARQAARSVLPNATETKVTVTANARALRHFLEMRGSAQAEPEIRKLASALLAVLQADAPNLFGDYERVPLPDGTFELRTPYRKV